MTDRELALKTMLEEVLNAIDAVLVDWDDDEADAALLNVLNRAREMLE